MDILDSFSLRPLGRHLEDLDTPAPLVDIDIVDRNLRRWQARCDAAGIANRPHIKTHKLAPLAKYQLAIGAVGVTVQKLGEAEVMADAGVDDMLLTFNIVGRSKLERLAKLVARTDIKVVADNRELLEGLAYAARSAGRDLTVLIECDTGAGRNGVQSPEAAADLAVAIDKASGLLYGGLMTYPRAGSRAASAAFLDEAKTLVARRGLSTSVISTGGSPDMWKDEGLAFATEYRAGTYAYFDRSLVECGACGWDSCALTVLSTVVSRPTLDRAIIDAGSKALTSDLLGLEGYGVVQDLGGIRVHDLNEEHGFLDLATAPAKPKIGDLVRVTPNHVCPVSNLFDEVILVRGSEVIGVAKVDARGKVQ
jgi:D-serine deaminase-like pyridoxal phosphate-dependent protein